ncbi:MAG: hypothetical protein Q7T11_04560 [Deltaproteobacteria bacterium]|nr:hypothetical protein [Deltaproteobacteria bacterium]
MPIIVLFFFLSFIPEALAYLDPGTGSMIIQIVIGSVLAISYTVKIYWKKLKSIFQKKDHEAT